MSEEIKAGTEPFKGLSLDGIDFSANFEPRKRRNYLPIDAAITPEFKFDANNNYELVKYGPKDSRLVIIEGQAPVALNYILSCPLDTDEVIANAGTVAECIITDETVEKVCKSTYLAKQPLPRFKAVKEGLRSIPVSQIKESNEALYTPLLVDLKLKIEEGQKVAEVLAANNFTHVPVRYKSSAAVIADGGEATFSPKVNTIALLEA